MQRQPAHGLSAHRMLDMVHRLSRLQAGGTDPASLLRAILQDTLAITDSRGGGVLLLEREQRVLRPVVQVGDPVVAETEMSVDELPWSTVVWEGKAIQGLLAPESDQAPEATQIFPLLVRGDVLGVLALYGSPQAQQARRTLLETLVNLAAHTLHQEVRAHALDQQRAE